MPRRVPIRPVKGNGLPELDDVLQLERDMQSFNLHNLARDTILVQELGTMFFNIGGGVLKEKFGFTAEMVKDWFSISIPRMTKYINAQNEIRTTKPKLERKTKRGQRKKK